MPKVTEISSVTMAAKPCAYTSLVSTLGAATLAFSFIGTTCSVIEDLVPNYNIMIEMLARSAG